MKSSQLAFADPADWCTIAYAADRIGVSERTVRRMIAERKLNGRRPRVGPRESGARHMLLYVSEVAEVAEAYKLLKPARA
jgi:excisionase family DNA binding protein